MKSTGQRTTSKRAGTTLTPAAIDAAKRTNAHMRSESMKDFMHKVKKISIVVMMIAIPVLYCLYLWLNRNNDAVRDEWVRQGIGAAAAFVLGKADFKLEEDNDSE